jgi:hypothetical protein
LDSPSPSQPTKLKRDPIRESPLRDPGQSLREQIVDQTFDRIGPWLVSALFVVVMAAVEWIKWLSDAKHSPVVMTIIAGVVVLMAVVKARAAVSEIEQLKLGLRGERAIGQLLQSELLPRGYFVLHDICIDNFNIDHVAIGPGGAYAVEVKTRRKPMRGDAQIEYDGVKILVNGYEPDRDPIVQAKAGTQRLEEILAKYSGQSISVRPVVIFPGWFVERQPSGVHVWVLNEKAFVKFLEKEPARLSESEVRVLSEGLARFVRDGLDG